MSDWYYARNGQQQGPITLEQLVDLVRSGGLDLAKDLVWTPAMKDWTAAGQVPELAAATQPVAAQPAMPAADSLNPYAVPSSAWVAAPVVAGVALQEIEPGSEPIDVGGCLRRGLDLTKRQFGNVLLVGVVYFGAVMAGSMAVGIVQGLLNVATMHGAQTGESGPQGLAMVVVIITQLITQLFSMFMGLGLTRVGLDLVSGKPVSVGQLFGEGGKLLRALGASILFGLMVAVGILFLIVPGIYLALRYGQYMIAIVDRDLGVMDAFHYSARITTNNRGNIFVLGVLSFLIAVAAMLVTCGIGLIFVGPWLWLSTIVAFRWMQYGVRAAQDHPGTATPLLAGT